MYLTSDMMKNLFDSRSNTFGMIVSWLSVLTSFLMAIVFVIILVYTVPTSNPVRLNSNNNNEILNLLDPDFIVPVELSFSMNLVNLLTSGMIVLGILKERHLMLLPWLILFGLTFGLIIIGLITLWFISPIPITILASNGFVVGFEIFLYYGVYSLYKQIRDSNIQQFLRSNVELASVTHQDYLCLYNI